MSFAAGVAAGARIAGQSRILTFKIDGKDVSSREDETILTVARQNNIFIPTLCHQEGLSAHAACRLCLVEIAGSPKLVPACVTYPREGIEVITDSDRIRQYRRMIVELLYTERNHVCSVCVSNGHCELQELAVQLGITHIRYEYLYPRLAVDASHERFLLDHNRCILCLRCARVCDEIEGAHTWDVMNRGIDSRLIIDLGRPWAESSTCTGCGKCVQVCPTAALSEKGRSVGEMIKRDEFLPYLQMMRERGGE